MNNTA